MRSKISKFTLPDVDVEYIVKYGPGHIYWKNLDSVYIGCNKNFATLIGLDEPSEIIGISEYDMPWASIMPETANHNVRADQEVIKTGKFIVTEENLGIKNEDGNSIILRSEKFPLIDKNGKIVGILGVSVDITDSKEKERLEIENAVHKRSIVEQQQFKKIVDQMVHDIGSPLASLRMLIESYTNLPEDIRIMLREIALNISGITNNVLNMYVPKASIQDDLNEQSEAILLSSMLLQLLSEKGFQYKNHLVKFEHDFKDGGTFAFIKAEPSAFKRAISNLINNSVDALNNKIGGKVILKIQASKNNIDVIVEDNGKGLSPELINKILSGKSVTAGKKNGHGIGLTQVMDMLKPSDGKINIISKSGEGTTIILSFPRFETPNWIASEISILDHDCVVILDDDSSIHGAWDRRFKTDAPWLKLKHFTYGEDAVNFINTVTPEEKKKILLLTDFELLNQNLNGLDVIKRTKIGESILVTSHYANKQVQQLVKKIKTKILPKQLASEISIVIKKQNSENVEKFSESGKEAEIIIVDDDQLFMDTLALFAFKGKKVIKYSDPENFLNNILNHSKDAKICLDNNFDNKDITGVQIADIIYNKGYNNIYIISGNKSSINVPEYIKVILKTDLKTLKELSEKW